jgi:hypothetical protein
MAEWVVAACAAATAAVAHVAVLPKVAAVVVAAEEAVPSPTPSEFRK